MGEAHNGTHPRKQAGRTSPAFLLFLSSRLPPFAPPSPPPRRRCLESLGERPTLRPHLLRRRCNAATLFTDVATTAVTILHSTPLYHRALPSRISLTSKASKQASKPLKSQVISRGRPLSLSSPAPGRPSSATLRPRSLSSDYIKQVVLAAKPTSVITG